MNELRKKGLDLLNQLHGAHTGEQLVGAMADICPDYVTMTAEFGFGQIFSRPGLPIKTRELIVVSLCTALGDMPQQLKAHLEAALTCGATKEECIESILQTCLYAGFARVTNAFLIAKEVFAEQGL